LRQKLIDFVNSIAKFFGIDPIINDTDLAAFKKTVSEVADALKTGRDIAGIVGEKNVGKFENALVQERIGAEDVLSNESSGKMKVTEVANTFEKAVDNVLDPSSDPNSRISRFLKNAYEDLRYFFGQYSGDTGLDWYTNKVKEFDLKLKDASDIAIGNGEMPAENSLRNEDNMDLFKAVLALSSIGVNPRENVKAAFAIWKTFNQETKTFNKYQPGQVSIRTNIEDGKGGYDAPSGTIVKETEKYLDIQQKNGKVRRLKKSDLAREFEVVYKNSSGKEITKNLRLVKVGPSNTIFRSGPTKIKIPNADILSQTEISDGIQGKGWTTKGNIVAINLDRVEKLLESKNTLREAIDWLNTKHPITELREYNPGVPDVEGGKGKIDPKGERLGSYIIGEKLGAFHQNVAGTPTELTMDLWWSRTWNRYMGTLMTTDEKGEPSIQETPRTDTERNIMREAAATAAESLGLEVHELQAALWYLEQQMYKRMGAAVESYSFVDGINELLLGYGKTNEEIQPQRYGVDSSETDKRRTDAAARAANILYGEGGKGGQTEGQASVGNRNLAPNGKPSNLNAKQYEQVRTPEFKNWFGDWENDPANASKVVDENGEPRVVFHGTNETFDEFKKEKLGSKNWMADSARMGFFFAGTKATSESYSGMTSLDMMAVSMGAYDDIIKKYKNELDNAKASVDAVYNRILEEEEAITIQNNLLKAEDFRKILRDANIAEGEINRLLSTLVNRVDYNKVYEKSKEENDKNGNNDRLKGINDKIFSEIEERWRKKTGANPTIMELFLNIRNPLSVDYKGITQTNLPSDIQQAIATGKDGVIFNNLKDGAEADDIFVALEPNQIKSATGNTGAFSTTDNRIQASVGNRSEEDLRAPGKGKERNRALSSKFGDLDPETQAKIQDDAVTYFQRPNKQTSEAVNEFLDGLNIVDAADYVLGNPDIPEVSKVWMAAAVAKRLGTQMSAETDPAIKEALADKQASIYNEFAKKATDLGQAVQAFIAFKKDPQAVEFFLPKILRELKKKGVENISEIQKGEIISMLKDVNNASEGLPKDKAIIKLSHYLAGIAPMKLMDVLQALWYAKILSGVTTQSTNFFANIFNTAFELPAVAFRIAMLNGSPMSMIAGVKGFGSGVAKGAITAADIMKSGVRSKEADKYFSESPLEYFTWSKWLGKKGQVLDKIPPLNFGAWKYIGRMLAATDALFSTANQEAIANMLAYAEAAGTPAGNNFKKANQMLGNTKENISNARSQATAEGFKPGTLQHKRRVIEIVAQGRKGTAEADAIGKRITMNYDPEGFTKPLFDATVALQQKFPAIKMVVPFARIVANLTENSLNYSPFGLFKAATGFRNPFNDRSNKLTTEERIDMFNKFAIGMTALSVLASKVGEDEEDWFEITAGGSTDIQKRYELQKGGWRPYTITLKDGSKISYKDWPIAGILAGVGHIRDAKKYNFDDSAQSVLYGTGFVLNLYDKSLLSGLQDFFGMFSPTLGRGKYAPDTKGMERFEKYAAQQVKSVAVSNLAQQTGRLYSELVTGDPQRDAKTFMEVIYRDLPMFNDGIRPIIDVFGDEVKYNTTERLTPVSNPEGDEMIKWLNENKFFVGVPKKMNIIMEDGTERPMNDQEYYEYRKLAGQESKKMIQEFMDGIKEDDRMVSESMFDSALETARSIAYVQILEKYGFK
jgi:hypothetical protein